MEKKPDIITWFEIPATDFERALNFYQTVLQTTLHQFSPDYAFFDHQNSVGGSIVRSKEHTPSDSGILVYLNAGDDLQPVLDRVEPAGGKIIREKELISQEIGYSAIFLDTEGNRLALHSRQ